MTKKKTSFAIVGLGTISRFFIEAIRNAPRATVIAVCDIDQKKTQASNISGARAYHRLKDMLDAEKIDAVIVAAPNRAHFEIISECLRAGKHVLCEKPLGRDYKETNQLIKLAMKRDLLLMTAFHRRYNNNLAKQVAARHSPIKAIHARYLENISEHTTDRRWMDNAEANGGGCIIDNGINVIDVVQHLVGDLKLLRSHIGEVTNGRNSFDANAHICFSFAAGGIFTLELDWLFDGEKKDLTIYYKDGQIAYVDFLQDFDLFKGSLKHEYQAIIREFIHKMHANDTAPDLASQRASRLVDQIYKKNANRLIRLAPHAK
jgi:predicted dehydrogenase